MLLEIILMERQRERDLSVTICLSIYLQKAVVRKRREWINSLWESLQRGNQTTAKMKPQGFTVLSERKRHAEEREES